MQRTQGQTQPAWRERVTFAYLEEPPFCRREADGQVAGCDVELARHVLAAAGAGPVDFVMAEFADLLPGLVDGRWTMTTGLFITAERARQVAFSRPVWALPDGLLVAAGNPKRLTGYGSIARDAKARLGVIEGQIQHDAARAGGIPPERIVVYATQGEAAEGVGQGEVEAYASVAMAHRGYLAKTGASAFAVVDVAGPARAGGFAFSRANDGLAQAVDAALAGFLGTPAHRALMARHGFGAAEVDRIATAS
ncbi:transporter substrate-binding domain-containing protein [Phreatobacter stygius]|uniref:Transporter substrate-binding domain-containing protein n=2 Tax=Phreatobacter stygius TaxID=1940610 RepID=A0A4D7B8P3_9HYPH|nr:transporter substrate-binding domain-containing protein [Phreatobacter stygius]